MELQIKRIHNLGDINFEFIELKANTSVNLKNFILSDTSYHKSTDAVSKHIYWFPELSVSKGTTIRLNTRKGINTQAGILDLYWNLDNALWKDKFATAYIIKIDHYVIFPEFSNYIDNLFSCD